MRPTIARRPTRMLCAITLACALMLVLASADPALALGPRALITAGPVGEVPSQDARFIFVASSGAPLSRFECRLDAGAWTRCNSPKTYAGLVGGPHRFEVRLVGLLVDPTPAVRDWVVALGT